MICNTLNDIYNSRPATNNEMRNRENKWWREAFIAAQFCSCSKWGDALICIPVKDEGDDVFVKYNEKYYPFQITEMMPKNSEIQEAFPKSQDVGDSASISEPYGSLKAIIKQFVCALVQAKNNKQYANQDNMNLLIYVNPPVPYIDSDVDIDKNVLSNSVQSSKFKTISLYTGSEIIFIKGEINTLATSRRF